MPKSVNKTYVMVGGLVLVVLCSVILLTTLALPGGRAPVNGGNDTSQSTSTTSSVTTTSSNTSLPAAKYSYAGIRPDDTLALFNQDSQPVTINLDRKKWKDLKWSPDGKLLAVLGVSGGSGSKSIYDIFIYNTDLEEWRQATSYVQLGTGVTGYDWLSNTMLAYTQGPAGNVWLHNYDYANSETKKIFRTTGTLVSSLDSAQQHLLRLEDGEVKYQVVNKDGANAFLFTAAKVEGLSSLLDVNSGRSPKEFVVRGTDANGKETYFLWNFNNPQFRAFYIPPDTTTTTSTTSVTSTTTSSPIVSSSVSTSTTSSTSSALATVKTVVPLCAPSSKVWFVQVIEEGQSLVFATLNPDTNALGEELAVEGFNASSTNRQSASCSSGEVVISVTKAGKLVWYAVGVGDYTELAMAEGYSQVVKKLQ